MADLRCRVGLTVVLFACAALGCAKTTEPETDGHEDGAGAGSSDGNDGGADAGGSPHGAGGSRAIGGGGSGGSEPEVVYPDPDWPEGDPADFGFDAGALEAAATFAATEDSYCMLVIRHGTIISEHYYNGRTTSTKDKSWSIAKSYSSAIVGIAIERGDIASLDEPVSDFIPEWQADERSAITIRNILTMTSGLEWSAFGDYVSMATFSQDQSAYAKDLSYDKQPGTEWVYNNGAVQILEPVFRAATGMTMEAYAAEHLWSRIGSGASWGHDPSGNPTAYANVLASCRDHARLGYLYLHGGKWNAEQVIGSSWVTATTTPSQDLNRGYGYLWWLNGQTPAMDAMMQPFDGMISPDAPPDLFAARGFGNQFIDVIPSLDLMVVRFGEDPQSSFDLGGIANDQRFEKHNQILNAVLDAMVE